MKLLYKIFFIGILLIAAFGVLGAKETVMYKKVDANGKITFTDKPIPGAKAIKVKTDTNVVSTPKLRTLNQPRMNAQQTDAKPFKYEVLAIDTPKDDEGVRANDGSVNVVIGVTPNLQPNHSIQLQLDGSKVGQQQKIPYFTLTEVERGTHGLQAVIINDETNEPVQSSDTITFHALKTSILNNNNRKKGR